MNRNSNAFGGETRRTACCDQDVHGCYSHEYNSLDVKLDGHNTKYLIKQDLFSKVRYQQCGRWVSGPLLWRFIPVRLNVIFEV